MRYSGAKKYMEENEGLYASLLKLTKDMEEHNEHSEIIECGKYKQGLIKPFYAFSFSPSRGERGLKVVYILYTRIKCHFPHIHSLLLHRSSSYVPRQCIFRMHCQRRYKRGP